MKNNKKLIVIVSFLLLVISVSLAYYVGELLISGEGATGNATTAKIKGATIKVEGVLEFNDPDILPGHKTISSIKVTATGNNELIPYNLIWKGTNGISQINYTVYKTSSDINVSTSCEKKTSVQNGVQILNEECEVENIDNLGTSISSGSITKNSTKEILASDEFITASPTGLAMYYYVILEYPNLDEDQSADINATFNGEVTVEESHASADINILAVYIGDETGNYTETTDIPQSGFALNTTKSLCNNGTIPNWDPTIHMFYTTNLTKRGTSCSLYFDKAYENVNTVLGTLNVNTYKPNFERVSTIDEGIYAAEDGMYGGTSYYWRGAATTNYLKFGGYCWRIIRINGDGTIRLIYDGTTCHANGTSTTDSIAVANIAYNPSYNKTEYVGWKYTEGLQRPNSTVEGTDSPIKTALENWYNNNIGNNTTYASKVADGKYCNDRNTKENIEWSQIKTYHYAASERIIENKSPALKCSDGDIYSLKIGLITADEIVQAGGFGATINNSFYLYTGHNYWSMSPAYWDSINLWSWVFYVNSNGILDNWNISAQYGIRPVINLKADTQISSGKGTLENPYIVS